MDRRILNYISKIQSYRTAIKNLHWSSKNMSEHKLNDEIDDKIDEYQDEFAEIAQGIFGKIEVGKLKPKYYKVESTKKLLEDILRDTKAIYSYLKGRQFIGLRSVVETFIADVNKYQYLLKFVLKEDVKRRLSMVVESKINKQRIQEYRLRKIIRENIRKTLKNI